MTRGSSTSGTHLVLELLWHSLIVLAAIECIAKQGVDGFNANYPSRTTATGHSLMAQSSPKQNPLDSVLVEYMGSGRPTVLIIDTNNVRGKDDFALWNSDLFPLLKSLRSQVDTDEQQLLHVLYVMDHGCQPEIFEYEDGLIVFAGPHRTADDVIAQAARFFSNGGNDEKGSCQVLVVTSDGELKQRCLRRPGGDHKRKKFKSLLFPVKVVGSTTLVSRLNSLNKSNLERTDFISEMERIESDIRWCTALHPPFKSGAEKAVATTHGPWTSDLFDAAAKHEMYPRKAFSELTWHRVLVAEAMRRLLHLHTPTSTTSVSHKELVAYKDFYENHQIDNSSGRPTDTMFLDHRIRREEYLQQQLLTYFQRTILCSSSSSHGQGDIVVPKSPSEQAAEFMMTLVLESPMKTHDEILARYMNEVPTYFQSSRKVDLSSLLKQLATREKRHGDARPKWYVREDIPSSFEDDDGVPLFQPNRSPRSEKRRRRSLSAGSTEMDVDLVDTGRTAEMEWLHKWNERLGFVEKR